MSTYTRNDRELNKIRSLEITPNFQPNNQSSCLVKLGNTHVCCSAILEDRVPGFLRNSGKGWLAVNPEITVAPMLIPRTAELDRTGVAPGDVIPTRYSSPPSA